MTNFTPQVKRVVKNEQEPIKFAFSLAKEGRFDEALAQFETILQNNPASKLAQLGAGNMLFRLKRNDEALRRYYTVMQLDALMPQAQVGAGRVYFRRGELEQAAEKFQAAINIDPYFTEAYQGLGRVLAQQEKYDEAIQQWRQAQRINPQLIAVRLLINRAYQKQGKLAEALSELKSAINIAPNRWRTYQALGRIYLQLREYKAAKEAFQTVLELKPDIAPVAKFGLAKALIEEDQLEEATKILRQMPKSKRIEPRKHQLWGDLYRRQGLLKEATDEYRAAALLAAEEGDTLDDLAAWEALVAQDDEGWQDDEERGEEVVSSYKAAADKRVVEARQRRLKAKAAERKVRLSENSNLEGSK
jgi:tetratricopeptide (TPR) repeat protein